MYEVMSHCFKNKFGFELPGWFHVTHRTQILPKSRIELVLIWIIFKKFDYNKKKNDG